MLPKRSRLSRAFASLCLIGSIGGEALAEALPRQPEMMLFDEPLVTAAAKHPQSLSDAPAAITIITREDIRRFGYRTLAEALRSVRGFFGTYDRNYSYIGVRGFLKTSDYSQQIVLLVNGHTYNDDIYGSPNLGPEFGIDMEAIERIEVVHGPASALYGGNALFAVVNVVTTSAQDLPGIRPLVETGSFGRKRGQLSIGHQFDNGLGVFASGSILDIDGQSNLFFPAYDTPETNHGVAYNVDGEQAWNFFLSATYGDFFFQGGVNRREKDIPTGAFETTFNDPGNKTKDGRQFAELQYASDPLPNVQVAARAYYDGTYYHGTYIYGSGADRDPNEDIATSHWVGGEVRGTWEIWPRHALTLGAEYTYHPGIRQENFSHGPDEQFLDDNRSYGTWAIYGQDEWSLLPSLTLVGGLRFDRYYNSVEEVSPRVAAIWNPVDPTRVKLLYGRAFRAPSIYEQYYEIPDPTAPQLGNTDLQPEHVTSYEAVLEQDLWRGATGLASVFHYELEDVIDQVEVPMGPGVTALQYRNGGSVHATGAEFELRVPLPHHISARGSYTIEEARQAGGQLLVNSPKHLGDLQLLFPLAYGVEGGAEVQLVGPRQTLTGHQVSTEAVANLTLNYATPIRGLAAAVGFYNIFDLHNPDPAGPEHTQVINGEVVQLDQIPQDGFTFRVQLQYAFGTH